MTKDDLRIKIREATRLNGNFILRSGRASSVYWDKYRFESDPLILSAITDEFVRMINGGFDRIAGIELGGVPLATALSLKLNKPCLFVRKQARDYGTQNLIEGGFRDGDIVIIVEDVVSTAGQLYDSIVLMREKGLIVEDVMCVIDREQGGAERLAEIGCSLLAIFTMSDMEA